MTTYWTGLIAGLGVLYTVFIILICIGLYLLFSYSLYSMATKRNEDNAILAWIPIANLYLLGKMIGNFSILDKDINNVELFLPLAFIVYFVFFKSWILLSLISTAAMIFIFYTLYHFYKQTEPDRALFYAIISALLPTIGIPVIFFMMKDK